MIDKKRKIFGKKGEIIGTCSVKDAKGVDGKKRKEKKPSLM